MQLISRHQRFGAVVSLLLSVGLLGCLSVHRYPDPHEEIAETDEPLLREEPAGVIGTEFAPEGYLPYPDSREEIAETAWRLSPEQYLGTVRTDFAPKALLTPDEVQMVVDLARESGMMNVREVATLNMHPGTNYAIAVWSQEETCGRYVRRKRLSVYRTAWLPQAALTPNSLRKGEFWVPHRLVTDTYGVFTAGGEVFRVVLEGHITLNEADEILSLMAKGRVQSEPGRKMEQLVVAETWKPRTLARFPSRGPGCYIAIYAEGSLSTKNIIFRIHPDRLVVVDTSRSVS